MTDINQMSTYTIKNVIQCFQVPQGIAGLKILKVCLVTSQIKEMNNVFNCNLVKINNFHNFRIQILYGMPYMQRMFHFFLIMKIF